MDALTPKNCNPETGGVPMCKLGILRDPQGHPYADTVQLQGASASEVVNKARDANAWRLEREFDVFIIGEAPGRDEDRYGIPFYGDAGDVLREYLDKVDFDLDRTYVTNMVKCRPPKNRRPAADEKKSCFAHLDYELRLYKPKVILLLGNSTLKLFNLDKMGGIGKIHGQVYERTLPSWEDGPVFRVIPTYHPAAFLHRPNVKLQRRVTDDYRLAKRAAVEEECPTKPYYNAEYVLCDTVDLVRDMVAQIKQKRVFAFDTESPDARYMRSPMILAQFSIGKGQNWVVPFYRHDPEGEPYKMKPQWSNEEHEVVCGLFKEIFEDEEIAKCGWFIKYDINVVRKWVGTSVKGWLWDGMNMKHLLDEYPPNGLEYCADIELGTGDYGGPIRDITGQGRELIATYDNIPDAELHPYGATDAENTYLLVDVYYGRLMKKPHLCKLYEDEILPGLYTFAEAEWHGCKLILPTVEALGKKFDEELEDLTQKCRSLTKPDFNPSSPDQVAEAFRLMGYGDLISAPEKSKGYSTSKDILTDMDPEEIPLAGYVVDYRNRRKMRSTYIDNALADIDEDGRIRYPFSTAGPTNGRIACRFFHQIPRTNKEKAKAGELSMRDMFGEEEGFTYWYGDFSQIELRIFAIITGDEELLRILSDPDGDVHRLTASGALNIPFDKVSSYNRDAVGKRLNFGVIYGSEGHALSKLDFENQTTGRKEIIGPWRAMQFVKNFRRNHPKVDDYLSYTPDLARTQGCMIKSVFGRERRMPELNHREQYVREKAERSLTNFTISSPAGAITTRTVNLVRAQLEEFGVGADKVRFLKSVHDSASYGVRNDHVEWFNEVFTIIAQRTIPELKDYSFPVNTGWGKTWTEAELAA